MPTLTHQITLIPGDGIGPEVTEAARRVLDAAGVRIEWDVQEAGAGVFQREGTPVPDRVIESIRERRVALKGPLATSGSGYRSPNIALRDALDLHTGVRPCKAFEGVPTAFPQTDIVVVRMNQEDLYAGIEYARGEPSTRRLLQFIRETQGKELGDDTGITIKPISVSGAERVVRGAFEYARRNRRAKVTAVHKANVMRDTDGLFLDAARKVAEEYPGVTLEERLVDAVCHHLVVRPGDYEVLVLPMMYGDIISDIGAGLIGGLGMAPGANIGDSCAVFEAAHGTAPRHAERNRANPVGLMLSGVMLLRHLGEDEAADRLSAAIATVVREGRAVTYDLRPGRDHTTAAATSQVAEAVIEAMKGAF